jgi:hypothetical protein
MRFVTGLVIDASPGNGSLVIAKSVIPNDYLALKFDFVHSMDVAQPRGSSCFPWSYEIH